MLCGSYCRLSLWRRSDDLCPDDIVASRSVLKPVCNKLTVDMNVNLLQLSITHVHELVRCVCGDDDDLACVRFERSGVYREGSDTFL